MKCSTNKQPYSIWTEIAQNPNMYCWVPLDMKMDMNLVMNVDNTSLDKINIQDIPQPVEFQRSPIVDNSKPEKQHEVKIDTIVDDIIKQKNKILKKKFVSGKDVVSYNDPEKFKLIKEEIIKRGLKVYGGLAINIYLPKAD